MRRLLGVFALVCLVWGTPKILMAEAARQIIFAHSEWRPMAYTQEDGRPAGLLVEIAREVMENGLGLVLKTSSRPWKRAQNEVKTGASDFLITVATEERKSYALASDHVFYQLPLHIYTYRDHPKQRQMDAIRSAMDIKALALRPVTNLGNGWHKENVDAFGIDTHYAGKEENILLFLASRRADIVIDAAVPTNYLIGKLKLNQKIVKTASRFSQIDFHLILSRKSRFADRMEEIDTAFQRAEAAGRIGPIRSRYETLDQ